MLYDPKWDAKIKQTAFIAWLEQQPADGSYDYINIFDCAYVRYLRSRGILACVSPFGWIGLWFGVIPVMGRVSGKFNAVLAERPHTYGALLTRAKA